MRRGPVFSRIVLIGKTSTYTGNGDYHYSSQPDIYGRVYRDGITHRWSIIEGRDGRTLDAGTAWTREGAWRRATRAAHRPGILRPGIEYFCAYCSVERGRAHLNWCPRAAGDAGGPCSGCGSAPGTCGHSCRAGAR